MRVHLIALLAIAAAAAPVLSACVSDSPADHADASTPDAGAADVGSAIDAQGDAACVQCGAQCVDLSTDPNDCGKCARACKAGSSCAGGLCDEDVVGVASSSDADCAVLHGGTVYCWGAQYYDETATAVNGSSPTPTKIPVLLDAVLVAGGPATMCAATRTNAVYCWGRNDYGLLGHAPGQAGDVGCLGPPGNTSCNPTPSKVDTSGLPPITRLVVGGVIGCVVAGGDLYCWGGADHGLLPSATTTPVKVTNGLAAGKVVDVAIGSSSACAVQSDGHLLCWGDNRYSELGHPPGTHGDVCQGVLCSNAMAVPAVDANDSPLAGMAHVGMGFASGCAIDQGGKAYCWGTNAEGEAGTGATSAPIGHPTEVAGVTGATFVAVGREFAVAGSPAGVWSWGVNAYGMLATGSLTATTCGGGPTFQCQPSPVPNQLTSITSVALGEADGIALDTEHAVFTWGLNTDDELGHDAGTSGDLTCKLNSVDSSGSPCSPKPVGLQALP